MAIDFNVAPYYDDFETGQRYYRILFKPGRSVQARELTQLQSILQNQIAAMGTNIFKEGTIVYGGKTFFHTVDYVKVSGTGTPTDFVDQVIVGQTSGARARVIQATKYEVVDSVTYAPALHFTYIDGTNEFQAGETIVIEDTATSIILSSETLFSGKSKVYNIQDSIFYTRNHFVFCPAQTVVVGRLTISPSALVGLKIVEGIANSDDDNSLLDPSVGTTNYFAPGADRYYIELTLTSINYDPTVEGSDEVKVPDFIQVSKVESGSIVNPPLKTDYNEVESSLARRTFDESGDYTVKPFIATVVPHRYGSNTAHSLKLSPGKAYVRGYEFETTSPLYLTVDRALTTSTDTTFPISLSYGNYVVIKDTIGMFYPTKAQKVYLSRSTSANVSYSNNTAFQANVIGQARVRYVDWTGTGNVYNMYLYDVRMNSNLITGSSNTFSETNSIVAVNISGASVTPIANCNVYSFGNATLSNPQVDNTSTFVIPQRFVKTLAPNSVSNISFSGMTLFENVSFASVGGGKSGGIIEVGLPKRFLGSGEISSSLSTSYYTGIVVTSASGPPVGSILQFGVAGQSNVVVTATNSISRSTLTMTSGGTFTANIMAVVNYREAAATGIQKNTSTLTKVIVADADPNVTVNSLVTVSLDYPDVYEVTSITDAAGNNHISLYTLDTGQRDDYYEHASLKLVGNSIPALNVTNNPNLTITYKAYLHNDVNQTGYFSIDSYNNVDFVDVPNYRNSKGRVVNLSDIIDFRAVRQPSSNTFTSPVVPVPSSLFTTTVQYYLPRKDKLVLTKDRRLVVVKGVPDSVPSLPVDQPDSMTLYSINVAPYTGSTKDVTLVYNENKRYTMRDIGKLDRRINRLEYYTALTFLEKIAADEKVASTIPGIDRFKNGIMVDSFAGHSVSDVANKDLRCSIDYARRLLRPMFVADAFLYSVLPASLNYKLSGDILTIDYDEESGVVSQLKASNTVPIMPFAVFNWVGTMKLSPQTDFWKDTKVNDAVVFNINGENDPFTIIEPKNGFEATATQYKYSNWETTGITDLQVSASTQVTNENTVTLKTNGGKISAQTTSKATAKTDVTTTYNQVQARSGLEIQSRERVIQASIGDRIVDASLLPYIRSKSVDFVAHNLKPNTQLFATFDNVDISEYVYPAAQIKVNTTLGNVLWLSNTMASSGSLYATANVIYQRADGANTILFVKHSSVANVFAAGNVATFYYDTGSTSSNSIVSVTMPESGALVTTTRGEAVGVFRIPNSDAVRFNVGERSFRLSDNLNRDLETTVAETAYLAQGITQTREEAIVATRVKDVNINPTFQTKKGDAITVTKTSTVTGPTTSAESNSVALSAGASDYLFCGETTKSTGKQGTWTIRLNLGTRIGKCTIRCFNSPTGSSISGVNSIYGAVSSDNGIPDKFTVIYKGEEYTTGFIGNSKYNARLKALGYEDVFATPGTGYVDISFYKHEYGEEFAEIKVDAPLAGTSWSVQVTQCPNTIALTAPGQCLIKASDNHAFFIEEDAYTSLVSGSGTVASKTINRTSRSKGDFKFTISNPSVRSGDFLSPTSGAADRSVTINSLTVDTSRMTALDNFSYQIITSGTSKGNDDAEGKNPDRTDARLGGQWVNTLGSLPVTLQPGESRTFSVRMFKDSPNPSTGRSKGPKGRLSVVADVTGPLGGGSAPVNVITAKIEVDTVVGNAGTVIQYYDPVAQSFIIDGRMYPNGMFLSSVDLWFQTKDTTQPVTIQIRPAIEGKPSADLIVPFGTKTLAAENIIASATFDKTKNTNFRFDTPVYLPPNEYAVVVICQSTDARLYISTIGQFELGLPEPDRIREQPYLGELFLSQNARSWVPEPDSDLTIRINRCKFRTTNTSNVILESTKPTSNTEYDLFYTQGDLIEFADTTTSYSFLTSTPQYDGAGGVIGAIGDVDYLRYSLGTNYPLDQRKVLLKSDGGSLKLNMQLASTDDTISPVIDMGRLGSVLVRNIINNDSTGEDNYSGGNAQARYITRKVILNPEFESQDLKVYLNAYLPKNSSIKVYFKVNAPGTTSFEIENKFVEMYATSKVGNEREGFAEYIFETSSTANDPLSSCLADGAKFNTFQIKIVMLSDDTTQVPIIRDLRAIAFDE